MPNYYAHFKCGELILERLPLELREELERERAAFDLGCLGPDPLFFYRPWSLRNRPRAEALRMHKKPGGPVLARLQKAMAAGDAASRGYAAGFLCHYAMDAALHAYVLEEAGKGEYSHMKLEAGFDRHLMDLDGYRTPRLAGFPRAEKNPRIYEAGANAYEYAGAKALRAGYQTMSLDARLLAWLCGKGSETVSRTLRGMMEDAVAETAERVQRFLGGEPLDEWYGRDFYGKRMDQ